MASGEATRVAVIGAGPAGMIAALALARRGAGEIHLFDRNREPGRKLLATGNGRCNLGNLAAAPAVYYRREATPPGDDALARLLGRFPPARVREQLLEFGLPTVATDDGWLYPASYSAANVVAILSGGLAAAGVRLHPSHRVTRIEREGGRFRLFTPAGVVAPPFDRLLVATGGAAFPKLGADTTLFGELARLGHRPLPFTPALAPLRTDPALLAPLCGVKVDVAVTVTAGERTLGRSAGNIIFTEHGVNGPGVMNVSHLVGPEAPGGTLLSLDFLPDGGRATLARLFPPRAGSNLPYRDLFLALLPGKVAGLFLARWGLAARTACREVDGSTFRRHLDDLAAFPVPVAGARGFDFAQVAAGGLPLSEVDPATLESRLVPGLHVAGEALDVVGPCGGYNLHWAWVSGLAAAEGIPAG